MLGPIFVIIAFFICFILGYMVCRFGGQCAQMDFGLTATIGIILFIILLLFLQKYAAAP